MYSVNFQSFDGVFSLIQDKALKTLYDFLA